MWDICIQHRKTIQVFLSELQFPFILVTFIRDKKTSQLKHSHGFSSPFVGVGVCSSQTDHEPAVTSWCPWLALSVRGDLAWRNMWGQTPLSQRDRISGHKHVLGNRQKKFSHTKHVEERKAMSHKTQDELCVKNLHVGGTASIGCCTHTLLCVFQVHLRNGLSGTALGCSPGRDLKPSHCLPAPSHTTPAWNRPPAVSWGTAG